MPTRSTSRPPDRATHIVTDTTTPRRLAPRTLLVLACVAVGFAAADTYVVVLALPDMMSTVGLNIDQLQRAAPIVSGFLLGYVAMLPLIGRIADLRGRIPVLVWSLMVFALGSLVTAAAHDLVTMVIGRFLQGLGGGGLVPATLALVAEIWPADRRGLPLGVVGAVQELGSVLGPLYGALVLTRSDWETIFWINMAVALVIVAAILTVRSVDVPHAPSRGKPDFPGALLGLGAVVAFGLVLVQPTWLTTGLTTGRAFIPYVGDSVWMTPIALACYLLSAALLVRELTASRPVMDLRGLWELRATADYAGALLLALSLGGIVLAFATAEPERHVLSRTGPWTLTAAAILAVLFWQRQRRAAAPLVPRRALHATPAWGAILVSFFVGSSLIAALVDIPVFARITVYRNSQLGAALVLVRLLAALPVGAVVGGYLTRRLPSAVVATTGMVLASAGFVAMSRWGDGAVHQWDAGAVLVIAGFGFGLTIAPVNASLLAATSSAVHGVSSALVVVARMIGMLVGLSALTTIGLHRFYAVQSTLPTRAQVCHDNTVCAAYIHVLKEAGIAQLHAIFVGAAVAAAIAAVLCAVLLGRHRPGTGPSQLAH